MGQAEPENLDFLDEIEVCPSIVESVGEDARSTSTSIVESTSSRVRNWCFTINNPTLTESDNLSALFATSPDVRYLVYQVEEGEQGTRHIQGYIELTKATRLNTMKRLISPRAHLEIRRGTRQQARDYCMKEESRVEGPFEYGEWIEDTANVKKVPDQIRELVDAGRGEKELWEHHFGWMVRYYRGVREYIRIRTPDRDYKTRVTVLYGPPRTGKSRWCMENFQDIYWKPRGEWWDGYSGQSVVVMDDFYGWIKYDELLRVCDRYPLLVPTKGGYANFAARHVAITSNRRPVEWYRNLDDLSALYERVEEWHYVETDNHHIVTSYDAFKRLTDI